MIETDAVSLTTNSEKVREEAAGTKAEFDKLRAAAESIAEEHDATLMTVREERQGELAR